MRVAYRRAAKFNGMRNEASLVDVDGAATCIFPPVSLSEAGDGGDAPHSAIAALAWGRQDLSSRTP